MNAQASRKLIVVGAMAVVVGLGVVTFAIHPHNVTRMALAITPPAPLAESPPAEDAVATTPEAHSTLAPVAPIVAAPAASVAPVAPAHKDVVVIKRATVRKSDSTAASAVEPKVVATRRVAATDSGVPADSNTVEPTGVAPDLSMTAAAAAVARSSEPVPSSAVTATAPAPGALPATAPAMGADQNLTPSATPAATDSEITANVKSQIAVDSLGKNASIGVITTNGAVTLTGSLASQDDIDHIKLVVASVKDVKSVDTSALSVPAS